MIRNENFAFPAGPTTPKLYLRVLDHRTLGKDKTVGEAEIDVSFFLSVSPFIHYVRDS